MKLLDLNGSWKMRCLDLGVFGGALLPAKVPGSMYADLLQNKKIEDPFYGENEAGASLLSSYDWEYSRTFSVSSEMLEATILELVCKGLDTIAEITLNSKLIDHTSDMHRTYVFNIRPLLQKGENTLSIIFRSPTEYMLNEHKKQSLVGGEGGQFPGFNYLRKSHSMSGWDWGPVLPDAGIWRDIFIRYYSDACLDDVYITQAHAKKADKTNSVSLTIRTRITLPSSVKNDASLFLEVAVTSPNGISQKKICQVNTLEEKTATGYDRPGLKYREENIIIDVQEAQLWWPNNLGQQPLYQVSVTLRKTESSPELLDSVEKTIGLRTITVEQKNDIWGKSFALCVNGVTFFAMGGDYVPEDSLLARNSMIRTERLIKSAHQANHNCIRIWGGANYPEDYFYDLCDKYGLIIWHDHMMACGIYELTESFRENITKEIIDNVKRVRHHASLGLWCGNNEQEEAWCSWGWAEKISPRLKADYIRLYEEILPAVQREIDDQTFYWLSSPSSGGSFDKPNDENSGDMHNWTVWHGLKPFTAYRQCYSRFMSEFGIESFPSLKTIESFTATEDRNIFSPVMENHQKCNSGNAKCLHYISETYRYPKDFSSLVYASQLIQAEGIRYGVEHWRRNRNDNRCMGAVYWQLNDCWPVASWASIDYFGRWKALHYMSKQFFSPVLVSACEEETNVSLHVTNETPREVRGSLIWRLCDETRSVNGAVILETGKHQVTIPAFTDTEVIARNFASLLPTKNDLRNAYLMYEFIEEGSTVNAVQTRKGSVLFVKSKHFNYRKNTPTLSVTDNGETFEILVHASSYARFIELETDSFDTLFSDNYFDLGIDDSITITVHKKEIFSDSPSQGTVFEDMTNEYFLAHLHIRSIVDTF